MSKTASTPVTLVNVLSVDPQRQGELVRLLRENTEGVIRTLKGWIATNLIASNDGREVVIHSLWETPDDIAAMRADPRMRAYFPRLAELASLNSILGSVVVSHQR